MDLGELVGLCWILTSSLFLPCLRWLMVHVEGAGPEKWLQVSATEPESRMKKAVRWGPRLADAEVISGFSARIVASFEDSRYRCAFFKSGNRGQTMSHSHSVTESPAKEHGVFSLQPRPGVQAPTPSVSEPLEKYFVVLVGPPTLNPKTPQKAPKSPPPPKVSGS